MNYKPLRDLLVIKLKKVEEKQSASGIFITKDQWNTHEPIATIEAIGGDVVGFKVGDTVLVNIYAVLDIYGEDELKIIKECDIIANVEA